MSLWKGAGMDVKLVLIKHSGSRKSFSLPSAVTVIGRRQDCDLCIPLMVVSRRHCEINHDQNTLKLRDLGSRNGTYVNGERVEEAEVKPGDCIQVGPMTFGLQVDGSPEKIGVPKSVKLHANDSPATERSGTFAGLAELDVSEGKNATELLNDFETRNH